MEFTLLATVKFRVQQLVVRTFTPLLSHLPEGFRWGETATPHRSHSPRFPAPPSRSPSRGRPPTAAPRVVPVQSDPSTCTCGCKALAFRSDPGLD